MAENKLKQLRRELKKKNIDGMIIWEHKNRYYFSGFTGTAGILVITAAENFLITDFRYFDQARDLSAGYELVPVEKNIMETLVKQLKKIGLKSIGFEENYWTYAEFQKIKEQTAHIDVKLMPAAELIKDLRLIKTKTELNIIKQAVRITDQAFEHIIKFVKEGMTEKEVSIELEYFMRKNGALGPSFEFIVASGKRGAMPHGVATDKKIAKGELVTVDFGCVFQGYCSDMTRNFIIGQPTAKQQEVYELVLAAQLEALAGLRAGVSGRAADKLSRDVFINANYGQYFGHGLGHGIGLNIHEGPTLGPHSEQILKSEMVVSVEPGIYLSDWGGVRIEDMVVVKENGCQILTNSPKHLYIL